MSGVAEYKEVRLLGEGGFGKVFLIENRKDPSQKHALKIIAMDDMDEYALDLTRQEIQLLSQLKHPHVLGYVKWFEDDNNMCIVTEFCPNGDLSVYIEERKGTKLEEDRLIEWFRQIASAVEYVHSKKIVHRDLKVENIFLDKNMDCKLGDFGIAKRLLSAADMAQTQIGTYHYMSPELFLNLPYDYKTDIWSLAVLVYELAALEKPFDAMFVPTLIYEVVHGKTPKMPSGYRAEFGALLGKMMMKDPDDRPSSKQIMQDKLFNDARKPKPMPDLRTSADFSSDDYDRGRFNLDSILQTIGDMGQVGGATKPALPRRTIKPRRPPGHTGVAEGPALRAMAARADKPITEEAGSVDPIMELVTRTLTGMGHNTVRPADIGQMQHQMNLLKRYVLGVLDNNNALFDQASAALDNVCGSEELEEKLIRVLGHERFGLCGVQLLHYKNFSYNIKHM